uniref:Uncharacterized protein n=1 Tax=Oryza brachyantha TaxID=4533 RepID=J3LBN9_ORYBR
MAMPIDSVQWHDIYIPDQQSTCVSIKGKGSVPSLSDNQAMPDCMQDSVSLLRDSSPFFYFFLPPRRVDWTGSGGSGWGGSGGRRVGSGQHEAVAGSGGGWWQPEHAARARGAKPLALPMLSLALEWLASCENLTKPHGASTGREWPSEVAVLSPRLHPFRPDVLGQIPR